MTKPNSTEIVFLVDRSGSMHTIAEDMKGGFKTFIDEQMKDPTGCNVSLYLFDDVFEEAFKQRPLSEVKELPLQPRGNTALLDAIGKSIVLTGERLAKLDESERPEKVVFVIITDGGENASREYRDGAKISEMITHQREKYSWEFVFLGANQDSLKTARSLGISANNAVTYAANSAGSGKLMRGLSKGIGTFRRTTFDPRSDVPIYGQKQYDEEPEAPKPTRN